MYRLLTKSPGPSSMATVLGFCFQLINPSGLASGGHGRMQAALSSERFKVRI